MSYNRWLAKASEKVWQELHISLDQLCSEYVHQWHNRGVKTDEVVVLAAEVMEHRSMGRW